MKIPFFVCVAAFAASSLASAQTPTVTEVPPPGPPKQTRPRPKPRPAPSAKAPVSAPPLLWKTFIKRLDNAPAVESGNDPDKTLLYLGANNSLLCLDGGGRTQWAAVIGPTQAQPAFDDTNVYIGTDRGAFYAVRRDTGTIGWKYAAPSTILTTPLLLDKTHVLTECSDGSLYALLTTNGTLAWSFKRPDGSLGYSSPVLDGGAIFVCGENTLYKLGANDGKELWRTPIGGKSLGTPSVDANRVFVGGDAGAGITALDAQSGKALWTFGGLPGTINGEWFGSPLAMGGVVYVSTYNRYVYALDTQTGRVKWSYRLLGNALARPVLDAKRNVLYVASITFRDNPTVTALDSRSGAKLWDYKAGYVAASPILAGERLYVASTNGYLYAFGVRY